MERQPHSPDQSPKPGSLRLCQAQISAECRQRGGRFLVERRRGKVPRYCPTCAIRVRREQSRQRRREVRREMRALALQMKALAGTQREQCQAALKKFAGYERAAYSVEEQREKWCEQKRRQREKLRARQHPAPERRRAA